MLSSRLWIKNEKRSDDITLVVARFLEVDKMGRNFSSQVKAASLQRIDSLVRALQRRVFVHSAVSFCVFCLLLAGMQLTGSLVRAATPQRVPVPVPLRLLTRP